LARLILASCLPSILIAPVAGAMVDRWDRRLTMIWSVVGQSIGTFSMAFLFQLGQVEPWKIYPPVIFISLCAAFQGPALSAASALMLPKEQYSRAGALRQLNQAAVMIISPILAVALVQTIHISGVVLIDAVSYLFAVGTLLTIQVPKPESSSASQTSVGSFLREIALGWSYIQRRRGLLQLLVYFAYVTLILNLTQILVMPLVLTNGAPKALATVMAVSACGMVGGSVAMTVWGGPKRSIAGVFASGIVLGSALIVAGFQTKLSVLSGSFFIFSLAIPLGLSCSGAIWMRKTEPDLLGRVSSTRRMISQLAFPAACFLAGPLADKIFRPLLAPWGRWCTVPSAASSAWGPRVGSVYC
jgi:MFS transporter, DHA3 family, macrolide efflux protein